MPYKFFINSNTTIMVKNIDDWMENQIDKKVDKSITLQTLKLRNEYAKLSKNKKQYGTVEEWQLRTNDEKKRDSFCEKGRCTVSLRL